MFRLQSTQLRGGDKPTVESLSRRLDEIGQMLSGCGPIQRDTDGHQFSIYGNSLQTAGISDWHAILDVWQQNNRAGTLAQPKLLAARFRGPVKFDLPLFGVWRSATATANWDSTTNTVAATDDETTLAIVDADGNAGVNLFVNTAGKQPNIRSGAVFWYFYDLDGEPRALSEDAPIGTVEWVTNTSQIRGGWQVADGTNSTVNLITRYPLGHATVAGTLSGSATHSHGATGLTATAAAHDHGAVTGNATPGLTGSITANTINLSAMVSETAATGITTTAATNIGVIPASDNTVGGAGTYVASITTNPHSHTITDLVHNHNFTTSTAVGSHGHDNTLVVASHAHSITSATPLITMGGNTADATVTPLSCTMIPVQRTA